MEGIQKYSHTQFFNCPVVTKVELLMCPFPCIGMLIFMKTDQRLGETGRDVPSMTKTGGQTTWVCAGAWTLPTASQMLPIQPAKSGQHWDSEEPPPSVRDQKCQTLICHVTEQTLSRSFVQFSHICIAHTAGETSSWTRRTSFLWNVLPTQLYKLNQAIHSLTDQVEHGLKKTVNK